MRTTFPLAILRPTANRVGPAKISGAKVASKISPLDSAFAGNPQQRSHCLQVKRRERGKISLEETASYNAATQVRTIRWYFSSPDAPDFRVIDYRLRVFSPEELVLLPVKVKLWA